MLKELNAQNQAYVVKNYFNNLDLSEKVMLDCTANDFNFYYRMCDLDYYSYNTLLDKCENLDCRLQNDSIYDSLWAFPNVKQIQQRVDQFMFQNYNFDSLKQLNLLRIDLLKIYQQD